MASPSTERLSSSLTEQLRALVPEGRARSFAPGETIFAAGDPGDGFYVVESGSVRISAVIGPDGGLIASLPWRTPGAIDARLPIAAPPTLVARLGNLLPALFAAHLIAIAIASRRKLERYGRLAW